jgi:hypothetical protein
MMWNIHYKQASACGYLAVSTFEIAIKRACELLDQGADVFEVASSGGCKGIDAEEIRLISAERKLRQQLDGACSATAASPCDPIRRPTNAIGRRNEWRPFLPHDIGSESKPFRSLF